MGKKSRRVRSGRQNQQRPQSTHANPPTTSHPSVNHDDELKQLLMLDHEAENPDDQAKLNVLMKRFEQFPISDPWNETRVKLFLWYCCLLREAEQKNCVGLSIPKEISSFVKGIAKCKKEPAFFRAKASHLAGFLSFYSGDLEGDALQHIDNAIAVCDSAIDEDDIEEMSRTINQPRGAPVTVREYLTDLRRRDTSCVKTMGTRLISTFSLAGKPTWVSLLAGLNCDTCARQRRENTILMVCGRCRMAHYCSGECQKQAWKELDHKTVCRKKGEFRVGDVVQNLDESFGGTNTVKLFRLKAPALEDSNPENPRQWVAEPHAGHQGPEIDQIFRANSLRRVRPGLWNLSNWTGVAAPTSISENEVESTDLPDLVMRDEGDEDDGNDVAI